MIYRVSAKLAAKLKLTPARALPLDPDSYADWSAHLFVAERNQYLILTNTASLYSVIFPGKGITNESQFAAQALRSLRDFLKYDGLASLVEQRLEQASCSVAFSKPVSRSVISSMNDLIAHARFWLIEEGKSTQETATLLNDMPFKPLSYRKPREVFAEQIGSQSDPPDSK